MQLETLFLFEIEEYNQQIESAIVQGNGCESYFVELAETAVDSTGSYTLILTVDPYDGIEEQNEENNGYASYVRVVLPMIQQTEQNIIQAYPLLSSVCVVSSENILTACPLYETLFDDINKVLLASLLSYTREYANGVVSQDRLLSHVREVKDGLVALDNRISLSW